MRWHEHAALRKAHAYKKPLGERHVLGRCLVPFSGAELEQQATSTCSSCKWPLLKDLWRLASLQLASGFYHGAEKTGGWRMGGDNMLKLN